MSNERQQAAAGRVPPKADPPVAESDQVVQRRANLEELKKLGVDPYPHRFDIKEPIEAIVSAHGAATGEQLEALQVELDYFATCIKNGRTPFNDGHAGLRVVRMLEAAENSIQKRGELVRL